MALAVLFVLSALPIAWLMVWHGSEAAWWCVLAVLAAALCGVCVGWW